jgi:mono/diheme cytochrome c family protein
VAYAQPGAPTAADVDAGKRIYASNCAQCHGPEGLGDGEAGKGLSPPPADVARSSKLPIATDAYLYWTIAEGGAPVGSAMPPFKTVLDETRISQVVAYLRGL